VLQRFVDNVVLKVQHDLMAAAASDGWNDIAPIRPTSRTAQDETVREREARERIEQAVRAGVLPKADNEGWAVTGSVDLISRVLIASTYYSTSEPSELDPQHLAAALTLLGPARRDIDRLEAQLILLARGQDLTWRFVADALGLQSPQAAAQRWSRLTGNAPPPTAEIVSG
jgi:hypothetical protein